MRCECDAREPESPGATAYHGGNPDGCPREANEHGRWVSTSPALCIPCLFGCAE